MALAYALSFFGDVMLYFAALGCLGLLRACAPGLACVPFLLLGACWLSRRLTDRGPAWLRWAPMAVAIPCLIAAGNWPGRAVALPMLVYLPLYVFNNRRAPDYDYAADHFRHSLIATGVVLFLATLVHAQSYRLGLPWLFLYFTVNMALLRLLRHDDAVARSRRFRLLNLAGVALVCAAGFALSQPAIIAALRIAWGWFADNVLLNLLALALYILQLALFAVSWLLALIPGLIPDGGLSLPPALGGDEGGPNLAAAAEQARALPAWVRLAVQGAGILLLAVIVFAVLRALSRRVAREALPSGTDEREALEDEAPPAPRGRGARRDPQAGVRRCYRRALMLLKARGGRVSPTMNTLQIQRENAGVADDEALAALRELYLPARYGEKPASKEDARRAREALDRLRRR